MPVTSYPFLSFFFAAMASVMLADASVSHILPGVEALDEVPSEEDLGVFAELFGELVWLVIGFAVIRILIRIKVLPEFRLGFLSPSQKNSPKDRFLPPAEAFETAKADVSKHRAHQEEPQPKQQRFEPIASAALKAAAPTSNSAAVRAHAVAIRELLRSGRATEALRRMAAMREEGLEVPSRAAAELLLVALAEGPAAAKEVMDGLHGDSVGKVPMDGLAAAAAECLRREDFSSARCLEDLARDQRAPMQYSVYEPLVKMYAKADQLRASELFKELHERGFFASEGLCGCLMARSGEAQHIAFAEEVADHLRNRSMMTLATYKTLMKVYASNGMHDRACDLYEEIIAQGIEPDSVMYGCLVKFAGRCGRPVLAQELLAKSKGGDVQNHMLLMRSAVRDGDVARSLEVLRQAEAAYDASGRGAPDATLYNSALDACVTAGRIADAERLVARVVSKGAATRVTYNTLMKGYIAKGDVPAARQVLKDMVAAGVAPDSASYNCLLGAQGAEACEATFETLREMERHQVPMDQYTVSIMMKVAKRARSPKDASRALAVLDRADVSVCDDEVLLNTALDACIARRDIDRLASVAQEFDAAKTKLKPSVHTFGLLIKAFCVLRKPERCQELWTEMVEQQAMTPTSIALSCMLDALCCASRVDEAVALLKEWKGRVPTNTIMYSTLIKGFASSGNARRAADMCDDLRADGLEMNLVAYTTLLDAHARVGAMEKAQAIFQRMQDDGCEPNVITYSALVKGHCLQGALDSAGKLFRSMLNKGLRPDAVIFNTLLDGCIRHSRYELVDQFLVEMEGQKVEPTNFTLSIIVKLWGKRRQLDKAFEAVRRAKARHSRGEVGSAVARSCLDSQVGACLVSACLLNQAPHRALEALDEIKSWPGCAEPDPTIYSAIIGGLVRFEEYRKAAEVAAEASEAMILRRRSPSSKPLAADSLQLLFKGLHQQGLFQELGIPLMQKLRLARMPIPEDGISTLSSAAASAQTKSAEIGVATGASSTKQRRSFDSDSLRLEPSWRRR